MIRNRRLLTVLAVVFVALAAVLYLRFAQAQTLDRITIIEENDSYVVLRAGGETGQLYKSFSFSFDDPRFLNWFGPDGWA